MVAPVDRTDDLVLALAAHHQTPATAQATLKPSPDSQQLHPFTRTAYNITTQLTNMSTTLRRCEARYTDFSSRGLGDPGRDDVDSAVSVFVSRTLDTIDALKRDAVEQVQRERGGSFGAHKLGAVAALSDALQNVSRRAEALRAARIRHAMDERDRVRIVYDESVARQLDDEHRRLAHRNEQNSKSISVDGSSENGLGPDGQDDTTTSDFSPNNDASLVQKFAQENATLVNDLLETREQVRQAERTVYAIANMNQLFATEVTEQAAEIETLYDLAVEATHLVGRGNRELRKLENSGSRPKYLLAGLALILALILLLFESATRRR